MQAPELAGKGVAKAVLSFDTWKAGAVRPATVDLPVHVITAVESPQLRATLKGFEEPVWRVAWTPDGKTLATLSIIPGEVKLWDLATRKERATLRSDLGKGYDLAFTPDGRTLAVGYQKHDSRDADPTGGVVLWDVATGRRQSLLQHAPPRGVYGLALSPDGRTLAAAEVWRDGTEGGKRAYKAGVTLWGVPSGKARASLADQDTGDLAFSPDGKVLAWSALVAKDKQAISEVRRRDLTTGQDLPALPNPASAYPLNSLTFSSDGRTLAGADYRGHVLLWDAASARVRAKLQQAGRRRVTALAFSPDGKTLAGAIGNGPGQDHEPGLIVLWDAATGEQFLTLTGHTNEVLSVAFSPGGRLLASGGADRTVRLWDVTAPMATGDAKGTR